MRAILDKTYSVTMATSLAQAKIAEVCINAEAHTFMQCIINELHGAEQMIGA